MIPIFFLYRFQGRSRKKEEKWLNINWQTFAITPLNLSICLCSITLLQSLIDLHNLSNYDNGPEALI